ncbi:MAG: DUF481 domain-containing protein [Bacteroidota bacterium]|nr:DUF481 domain-containing protein [Bacteroidota bacterium]
MKQYLFIFLLLISFSNVFAQTDTLLLSNGDEIIGEIKDLDKGVLIVETDYSDNDFEIEWDKVKRIRSGQTFMITLSDGTRLHGGFHPDPSDSSMVIINDIDGDVIADYYEIVFIKAVKSDFLGRLNASIDIGFTLTKANNLRQFTSRSSLGYIADNWGAASSYNMVISVQDSVADTKRTDANLGFKYLLKNDWFVMISSDFLQNDELGLKLRTNLKGSFGNNITNTNKMIFSLSAGVAWNNEAYIEEAGEPDRNSVEGYAGLNLNLFNMGDISLLTKIDSYPSLTEKGRFRLDFNFDLKYDIPWDFYIKVGYTHNFDNQPVAGAPRHDYVLQTTFGWEL